MKKSDDEIINLFFENIGKLTLEISQILDFNGRLPIAQISRLSVLYGKRQQLLEKIEQWTKSDDGSYYISSNNTEWKRKISPLIEHDNLLINKIEKRVNELGSKIRNMVKHKSLLIYAKDNYYEH